MSKAMPVHDWTRVEAGIFHHFHHCWIAEINRVLTAGLLPSGYYALAEQITSDMVPDVLALQHTVSTESNGSLHASKPGGAVMLAEAKPQVSYHVLADKNTYTGRAKVIKIRHSSNHKVVAVIEVVSPGNKAGQRMFNSFIQKAVNLIQQGINLLVLDLFPPSIRDPEGIHKAIWNEIEESDYFMPEGKSGTLASYRASVLPEAFVEVMAIGDTLVDMPVFLNEDQYIPVPLEETYQKAWETVPEYWREVIAKA